MEMALFAVLLFLIVHTTNSSAGIISSSGLQREHQWQSCIFQWTMGETIVSYNISNQTTGSPTPLSSRVFFSKVNGVISLAINNIRLWDAGNYSLRVTTVKSTYVDATACLFVYDFFKGSVNLTVGTETATEGDTVELTCILASTSLPASYRTDIYYAWGNWEYGRFKNISSGTAMLLSGDLLPGYTIKNNGRTLLISSVRYPDDRYIYCYGSEDSLDNNSWNFLTYPLQMRHRPYIHSFNPSSKKFTAIVGTTVTLSLGIQANPPITSIGNRTFVNSAGIAHDLPLHSVAIYGFYYPSLRFNFTSVGFYGHYTITLTNALGSTTATFQVLPPGPPEAPSNLQLIYVSHCEVYFQWNLMWSNTVAGRQIVVMRLRLSDTNADVQTFNSSLYREHFNVTYSYLFTSNIQPLTNYIVSVWSVNSFGSSEVVEMKVKTRSQTKLSVSPQMISINGTQAIINFTVELGENAENISKISARCCLEFSEQCGYLTDIIKCTSHQIAVNNIPNGTDFYVDVTVYSGIYEKYNYYSDSAKGIKVSRTGNFLPSDSEDKHEDKISEDQHEDKISEDQHEDTISEDKHEDTISEDKYDEKISEDKQFPSVAVFLLVFLLKITVVALLAFFIVYLLKNISTTPTTYLYR